LAISIIFGLLFPLKAQAGQHGKFYIVKVNRIEKKWVLPPDRRGFMGSYGLRKFNYARLLPPEQRGEHYIITWRYRGKELSGNFILKFEYKTVNNSKKPYVEQYSRTNIKRGAYKWTFKNTGDTFLKQGRVDRWRVRLIYKEKVVAEKRSATWRSMEGG